MCVCVCEGGGDSLMVVSTLGYVCEQSLMF